MIRLFEKEPERRSHASFNIGADRIDYISAVAASKEVPAAAILRWVIDEYRAAHPEYEALLLAQPAEVTL